jgi:hypothetical protein
MGSAYYRIRVSGYLGKDWSEWFDGMAIVHDAGGDTLLEGSVVDQAALFGLLLKVRDLGLTLLSVIRVELPHTYPDGKFLASGDAS